jgi:hypothetical protein
VTTAQAFVTPPDMNWRAAQLVTGPEGAPEAICATTVTVT